MSHQIKSPRMACKYSSQTLEIKEFDENGCFEGYGSVFGNKDSGGDIVIAGAFKDSIDNHVQKNTMPAMLWQHDHRKPIGVWECMKEDGHGLYVKGRLALETQLGKEAYCLMKMGALKGLSIGYATVKDSYDKEKGATLLEKLDLWETSLVTFAMNSEASVSGVKSIEKISGLASRKEVERFLRDVNGPFSQKAATAMVAAVYKCFDNERDARNTKRAIIANSERFSKLLS